MTDRLLTDEEILAIIRDNYGAEGEPHPIPVSKIADASQAKTLKAVGEWLETKGVLERDEGSGDSYWDFSFILRKHQLDQLKQGKMPDA